MGKFIKKETLANNRDWLYQKYVIERLSWADFYTFYKISPTLLQCRLREFKLSRQKIAWNKNTKGVMKANKTSFKKGDSKPKNAYKFPKGACGLASSNYKDGKQCKDKYYYCIDCGKEICYLSKRCIICWGKSNSGKNHWAWNPYSEIYKNLRQLDEYKEWRMNCLKRDYFRCQECFSKEKLEVHHKISFRELVAIFLQEYNQFSPIEDREILIRLAINWKPFWEIDNGVTLCEEHHKSLRRITCQLLN